jgi:exosortase
MLHSRLIGILHGLIGVVLAWAYWPTLVDSADRWYHDPQYSHAFLVPMFSAYLLWRNRAALIEASGHPRWWGLGLFALGLGLRYAGHAVYLPWLDASTLLVCLAGWAAVAGGWPALRAALPAILFLGFTLPLPFRLQIALGGGLQTVATAASTYVLQTVGVPAVAEGHTIVLSETKLGVVEACNGLSMLMTFFALATGFAILIRRPWWDRALVVASAIPIAVAANVVRISVTGVLYDAAQDEWARVVFHDVAGWLMMPLALGLMFAEVAFLRRAIVPHGRTGRNLAGGSP